MSTSTPEKTAERMRDVARRILASERPSASRVAAELRDILAEVEGARKPDAEGRT
jgi:hypothetical protein